MSLKILKKIKPKSINCFIVTSTWYQGDADGNFELVKSFSKAQANLAEEYYKFLLSLKECYRDNIVETVESSLENFSLLKEHIVYETGIDDESDSHEIMDYLDIPLDATTDYQVFCRFESIKIQFFDKNGEEYKVSIK